MDVFNAAHKLAHKFPDVGISLIVKPPHGKQFVFATNGMAADGEQRVAGERVQREVQLAEYRQDPRHLIRSRGNIPPESNSRDPPSLAKSDCNDPPPSEPNIPTGEAIIAQPNHHREHQDAIVIQHPSIAIYGRCLLVH
jgi:hypothetical protein